MSNTGTGTKPKLLFVEDDRDVARGMIMRLNHEGFAVTHVADALAATKAARDLQPDVILLDLGLPGGGGWMVLERVGNFPSLMSTPVVVLSGQDAEQNRARAEKAGVYAYVQKPAEPEEVISVLRDALAGKPPQL